MTPELLAQRRWQRVAELIEAISSNVIVPVILPPSEGGGILIIMEDRAFHFFNAASAVNVYISKADTGEYLEGRVNCFGFDMPLEETVKAVCGEVIS